MVLYRYYNDLPKQSICLFNIIRFIWFVLGIFNSTITCFSWWSYTLISWCFPSHLHFHLQNRQRPQKADSTWIIGYRLRTKSFFHFIHPFSYIIIVWFCLFVMGIYEMTATIKLQGIPIATMLYCSGIWNEMVMKTDILNGW